MARVSVFPPIPAFTTAMPLPSGGSRRAARRSSQRSCASTVEQVPLVIESPKAMIALVVEDEKTSTADNQYIEVVVTVNALRSMLPAWLPAPLGVRYEVVKAEVC